MLKGRRSKSLKGLIRIIRFLKDGQVPFIKKLPAIIWVIYLIAPVDFLPDPVLGLGIIDDAVLLAFVLNYLNRETEKYRPEEKGRERNTDGRVIDDVEYHVSDDDNSSA